MKKGYIRISRAILSNPTNRQALFGEFNPESTFEDDKTFITNTILFVGYSEHFRTINKIDAIPEYKFFFRKDHDKEIPQLMCVEEIKNK